MKHPAVVKRAKEDPVRIQSTGANEADRPARWAFCGGSKDKRYVTKHQPEANLVFEDQGLKPSQKNHTSSGHGYLVSWLGFALNFPLDADSSGTPCLVVIVGGVLRNAAGGYIPIFHAPEGALIRKLISTW